MRLAPPTPMSNPFESMMAVPRGEPLAMCHLPELSGWQLCTGVVDELSVAAGDADAALARLDEFLTRHRGRLCAGWLGYDLGLDVEAWPLRIVDDFPVPLLHITAFDVVREFPDDVVPAPPAVPAAAALVAHISRADYEARAAAVIEHIEAGDIFQANLTQPFTAEWDGDPRQLFWRLCAASPAPRAAYVADGGGIAVLSSSPEEFLSRSGDVVSTVPIKGTRPRAIEPAADEALLRELLASEKDCAELAMIVDLMRNDLGKVALTGSVHTSAFPQHASFAQVHHLLATVTARLPVGLSHGELLRATFPGGSITGCPKLRCLEILESLEVARRGVYTGAIGTFGPGPRMSLNIAIRTLVHRDGRIRTNAGGGITALSDPAIEFEETLHKMAGIEQALQCRVAMPEVAVP